MNIILSKYKLLSFACLLSFLSCVTETDFPVPEFEMIDISLEGNEITIGTLRQLLIQEQNNNENEYLSFVDSDFYLSGYVISSDEAGNFFEELIIQDAIVNPTAGVKILLDTNPLFISYEFGRKVFVQLDGLSVGYDSGVLSLGILDGNSIAKISESQVETFITRATEVAIIEPLTISRDDFEASLTNLYVHLQDVQFRADEVLGDDRKTFAAESSDAFDGERKLVFCENRRSVIFSTSTFSNFKALLLPQGRGSLDGILTFNFFGEDFNIVVNDPSTLYFKETERCDPVNLVCGLGTTSNGITIFGDNFETQENNDPIFGNGWTNVSEEGTVLWEGFDGSNNNPPYGEISAQIGSFNSGDASTITWLITPEIDFDPLSNPTLTFLTSTSFADESILEVLVSNNWDGSLEDIDSFEWAVLSDARIAGAGDPFQEYISSGVIDLSCIEGRAYIAWRYTGSGAPDFDGTYELDEIMVKSN